MDRWDNYFHLSPSVFRRGVSMRSGIIAVERVRAPGILRGSSKRGRSVVVVVSAKREGREAEKKRASDGFCTAQFSPLRFHPARRWPGRERPLHPRRLGYFGLGIQGPGARGWWGRLRRRRRRRRLRGEQGEETWRETKEERRVEKRSGVRVEAEERGSWSERRAGGRGARKRDKKMEREIGKRGEKRAGRRETEGRRGRVVTAAESRSIRARACRAGRDAPTCAACATIRARPPSLSLSLLPPSSTPAFSPFSPFSPCTGRGKKRELAREARCFSTTVSRIRHFERESFPLPFKR